MNQQQEMFQPDPYELLSTKLAPQRTRMGLVPRPALTGRLDAGVERKLTLLSAPAGFGKTTLVAEWLAPILSIGGKHKGGGCVGGAVAWLALDEGDNDPVRFWRYMIAACQTWGAHIGQPALALLRAAPQVSLESVITLLINELAQLDRRGVLVVEDYHTVAAPQIHEALAFFIDHLPDTLHLVVITRSDPPLPLARWRARGEMNELRMADLRFEATEIAAFLQQQKLPAPLTPVVLADLEARTEGWVAGLRLIVLALQGRQGPGEAEQFLQSLAGAGSQWARHILEYLVSEVLVVQPPGVQDFLLRTSFLSRLTGSLCDAVLQRQDSTQMLEQIEHANLFLTPLEDGQGRPERAGAALPLRCSWYRYHALFAEAMLEVAHRRFGEETLRALYGRASDWYLAHDLLNDAVESALSAQMFDNAASVIEQIIDRGNHKYELHTLRRWIEQIPEAVLRRHPQIVFTYAVVLLFSEDRHAPATRTLIETPLHLAEEIWIAQGNQAKLGEMAALHGLVDLWQGDLVRSFARARQALKLLPKDERFWRGPCLLNVALETLLAGRPALARQQLVAARQLCEASGNSYAVLAAQLALGDSCIQQGQLHQAANLYREVMAQARQFEAHEPPFDRGAALGGLAALVYEWNDLEAASELATEAANIGRQLNDAVLRVSSTVVLARTLQARGQAAEAQSLLRMLEDETSIRDRSHLSREVRLWSARLALASGNLTSAERWHTTILGGEDDSFRFLQEQEALVGARILIAQEEAVGALALLEPWLAEARREGRIYSAMENLMLQALARFTDMDMPGARTAIHQAVTLAQPEDFQRLFLDEGEVLATLLNASLADLPEGPLKVYVRKLLYAFGQERSISNGRMPACGSFPLVEPLSQQEQRVLRLLAGGRSNPEIAQTLIVSINTVKTQVKSIFRKLNVNNRAEARDVARQFDLV